ncbi:TonB-dependent siderophore receptor [Reyranella sp. CPCC 100927]|uniref:TonB-dependent siderophore receptor n=1 Tax=Reyranella sp. CPCC 100927 TaxID=2599616 RepID=UPI0011B561C3|nr:TonB-dependent siderophore receptor [Reyranella sp. CPCC 100927]TWT01736.1 TonB-dependent siderophore receptor [Reyranella sp. CPCC 100927]
MVDRTRAARHDRARAGRRRLGCVALVATTAVISPVWAQQAPADGTTVLEPLTIGADRATTATKTDTKLTETPQSISVVPSRQIVEQGATELQDALRYSAGVRAEAYGFDTRQNNIESRGFAVVEYQDGLNRMLASGAYPLMPRPDPYTLERIELLRGPSSVLYGAGTTGGVVNMVSKRPRLDFGGEVGVQYGTYDRKQLQFDVTGALNAERTIAGRLVGVVRDAGMQTDHLPNDRYLFAPSLMWRPDERTSVTFLGLFQKDNSASSQQFLPVAATLKAPGGRRLSDRRFLGEPTGDTLKTQQTAGTLLVEHRFNDWLKVNSSTRFVKGKVHFVEIFPDVYSNPTNPFHPDGRTLDRLTYEVRQRNQAFTTDNNLQFDFTTGVLTHKVLVGVDYLNFRLKGAKASGSTTPIDAYSPVYGNFDLPPLVRDPKLRQTQIGVYVQDQIRYSNWASLVLGIRRDHAEARVGDTHTVDNAVSVRAGLIIDVGYGLSPYISYSESFQPVSGLDLYGQVFKPQRGRQYEAGIKWQPEPGTLVTLSAFHIRETNRLTNDPENVLNTVQTGEVRSRGVELEASWAVTPELNLIGAYTFTDAKITKSGDSSEIGEGLDSVPKHMASIWGVRTFKLSDDWAVRVGLGVRYVGATQSSVGPGKLNTPGYALVDGLVAVDWQNWSLAVNAANLLDKRHYTACRTFGDCFMGNRRTAIATLTRRF